MLLTTHLAAGAAIYQSVESQPGYIRWPVVLIGGFVSHFVLDSVITYHAMPLDKWYGLAMLGLLIFCTTAIWYSAARHATHRWQIILPPQILVGLWAWLSWDGERFFGTQYLHLTACRTWAPRYFARACENPWTMLWEIAIVILLTIVIIAVNHQREING